MINDPKDRHDKPSGGMLDDFNAIDQAMLLAISHRQRDSAPLSLDQERLLDSWIAGRLPSNDAVRAAELTKHNRFAAEHIIARRLVAVANKGPGVPSVLTDRVLRASGPYKIAASVAHIHEDRPIVEANEGRGALKASATRDLKTSQSAGAGAGGLFGLRWPTLVAWQWSGMSAAAAAVAVIAVFGFQAWQASHLRSNQSFQIAMVTIEDRSVLSEGPRYRTRGGQPQFSSPGISLDARRAENRYRDLEVPTALLRRAIKNASTNQELAEHSELMAYLRVQNEALDRRAQILIDSALADSVRDKLNEYPNTQIRAYDLDDLRAANIRNKIHTLQTHSILLTLR